MGKAKKCDRCGVCFDPLDLDLKYMARFSNPIFYNAEDIKNHCVGYYLISRDGDPDPSVDLCAKCAEDFELFMENVPLKLKESDFDKPDISE